jgi:hypothetical protein
MPASVYARDIHQVFPREIFAATPSAVDLRDRVHIPILLDNNGPVLKKYGLLDI